MAKLRQLLHTLQLRGWRYLGYLVAGVLWPRLYAWVVYESRWAGLSSRLACRLARRKQMSRRQLRDFVQGNRQGSFLSGRAWLAESTPRAASGRPAKNADELHVLGRIDNDGRVLPLCGPLPSLDEVTSTAFVNRYRYDLDLVLDGDDILIRKDFRGDREAFLREWSSLAALGGMAGVPAVHHADEKHLVLFKGFVPGQTVRQRLVEAGARILSVETESDTELVEHDAAARIEAVWHRGRERFATALAPGLLEALEYRLDAIHRLGVTGFSLSFGNVVIYEGSDEPWFIDFDAAETHRHPRGLRFSVCRDRDRALFNRIYGRDLLTERTARELLRQISTSYSPIDLGRGLASRGFWSVDSGTGRWELLNRRALSGLIEGRRILDLGSYNGVMPLSMLAAGARQVVAVEREPELVEHALHLHRLFEWRDMKSYDLDMRCADMRTILNVDLGRFDLVTAFCSLYYLDENDMRRVVRQAAELAPILVLQAKTDTRATAADNKATKSSLSFLRSLLAAHGFPHVDLVAPAGYSRPLLIGRAEPSTSRTWTDVLGRESMASTP